MATSTWVSPVLSRKYEISRAQGQLGEGAFATVYPAVHRLTRCPVAIKVLNKARLRADDEIRSAALEAYCLRVGTHVPFAIRLIEWLEDDFHVFFVLQLAPGGDLATRLDEVHRLREKDARRLFAQLALAVQGFHRAGLALRDLKADNVLLHGDNCCLIDFGLAAPSADDSAPVSATGCGTRSYSAPEVSYNSTYNPRKADVYSLGVILFLMVAGDFPFDLAGEDEDQASLTSLQRDELEQRDAKMRRARRRLHVQFPPWISVDLERLLRQMLEFQPEARPTIDVVCEHVWCRKEIDLQEAAWDKQLCAARAQATRRLGELCGVDEAGISAYLSQRKHDDLFAAYNCLKAHALYHSGVPKSERGSNPHLPLPPLAAYADLSNGVTEAKPPCDEPWLSAAALEAIRVCTC
ncbi:uncharacterized protein MONBRDRAFT_37987 [Monosiga brevicollis MX1]|uniref:Protein kinase domain-containing protein n=1 Tax=Monosiga brevicollis TaxID=81824 RepID=A9V519_MONBE|nr:uncharacterized protein MONBRDRAFT_37987 [Monosiga brevicollis MX1]EDQ87302.1 predicted protein [Monosiga brevicollis MX1]|eukprot:XP_001747915.1 hypothetical protein [Monosiga brevicollis MX1]